MTKKKLHQHPKRAKRRAAQAVRTTDAEPKTAKTESESPAPKTFTLASFHRAFGDNYGIVQDGQEPDPLKLALDCIDDLARTLRLCEAALFNAFADDYNASTVIDVIVNAHYRADAACKVLTPFYLRAQKANAEPGEVQS